MVAPLLSLPSKRGFHRTTDLCAVCPDDNQRTGRGGSCDDADDMTCVSGRLALSYIGTGQGASFRLDNSAGNHEPTLSG